MTQEINAVPYFKPSLGDEEVQLVSEVIRSGWLTTGKNVQRFETEFAQAVNAKHAIATSSCTSALHLALIINDIGPGDEVIVPTMTFVATAEVIQDAGATPVMVDCKKDDLTIDPACVEAAITERTKAIMPVHYGGNAVDMDALREICSRNPQIRIIEDAAHAFPSSYKGEMVGSLSSMTCFSFYANKTMTTGEGGMLTTDDDDLAQRARLLRIHGMSKDAFSRQDDRAPWDYDIAAKGFKYNLNDMSGALGVVQLKKASGFRAGRAEAAALYDTLFADVECVDPLVIERPEESSWHLYVVRLNVDELTITRNDVARKLNEMKIGTSVHYRPLHLHTHFRNLGFTSDKLPVATDQFQRILTLPLFPSMTEQEVRFVVQAVKGIVDEHRK